MDLLAVLCAAFAVLAPLTLAFLRSPRHAARFKVSAGTLESKGL